MSVDKPITKENIDLYLKELAKEYRKRTSGKVPAEIILIGGASILVNYGFREMTYDIDALIQSSDAMKDAIRTVGDRLSLPIGWMNTDFKQTKSYTPKLYEHSKYYKTFSNIVQVRTISAEYLVVMKLMAGRQYKYDLSDVIGVLIEQKEGADVITLDRIRDAATELYGSYDKLPEHSRTFIEAIYQKEDLREFYRQCRDTERENKDILVEFEKDYPNVLNQDNLQEILKAARNKK